MRFFVSFCVALAAAWLALSSPAFAQASAQVETVETETTDYNPYPTYDETIIQDGFRDIKRDEAYQFDLADPIPPKPQSAFSKWLSKVFGTIFRFLAPLLEIAFWLGLGALVLGALYLIGRAVYETRFAKPTTKKKDETPEIPLYEPAKAQARILLDEVDRLAAEGRFGEAVHTLLFRSIQDIDRNRPNVVRRSLTAREIGKLPVLTQNSRQAFSTIAGVSELSHFGGTPIGQSGFEVARKAYADLTGQSGETPARRRRR